MRKISGIEQFIATGILMIAYAILWKLLGIEFVICFGLAQISIDIIVNKYNK
jgi:hypothetical protein